MLDWSLIDNDKLFQRLVNELFALELNKPGYKPSSPYIGADGGWDGRFENPYMGLTGTSSVQAKWTKHSFDEAYTALVQPVKDELGKAKTNQVANLFLATNADLRVGPNDHIGKLEKLNNGEVKNFFIYPREQLTTQIERHRWLKYKYFRQPQHPLLAPASDYASVSEPDLLLDGELLERSSDLDAVRAFVTDGKKNILIVHSRQGEGKSRFLIEAAQDLQQLAPEGWQAWFCRPSLRTVEDAFQDEINPDGRYVLFLDNADLYEPFTQKLIAALKANRVGQMKIVLSCWTLNRETVLNWVRALRVNSFAILELRRLSEQALVQLLGRASGGRKFEHPERIVSYLGANPFFVIQYGRLSKGDVDPAEFRAALRTVVEAGGLALTSLGFSSQDSNVLLRELAAIVPFQLTDSNVVASVAAVVGKPEESIRRAVQALLEGGVLRPVGSTIRFSSDLNGNVFLASVLDETGGQQIASELYARWLTAMPTVIAANMSAAAHYATSQNIHAATSELVRHYATSTAATGPYEKKAILAWMKYLAPVAPGEVTDLLNTYLEAQIDPSEIGRDEYGPVVTEVLRAPGFQTQALEITRTMALRRLPGTYSNYTPESIVREAVSPIKASGLPTAIAALAVLADWSRSTEDAELISALVLSGINEALGGSHEFDESYRATVTWGRRGLVYSEKVGEYRGVAMRLLHELLQSAIPQIQAKAVAAINEIGHDTHQASGPLWERILEDRREALGWIAELVDRAGVSFPALAAMETVLIRTWAHTENAMELCSLAEAILLRIDRSPEYLLFKFLTWQDFIFSDYKDFSAAAPTADRWSWLVHNRMRIGDFDSERLNAIVVLLCKKYITPQQLLDLLLEMDAAIGTESNRGHVPWVEMWVENDRSVVLSVVQTPELWNRVPERFRDGFHNAAARNIGDYLEKFAASLSAQPSVTASDMNRLIDNATQTHVACDAFLDWMRQLLPKLDEGGLHVSLNRAIWFFEQLPVDERDRAVEFLELCLARGFDFNVLGSYELFVHRMVMSGMTNSPRWAQVCQILFDGLKDAPRIDYHGDHLLAIIVGDDLALMLKFLEHRLRKAQESQGASIDAIPYGGFEFLRKLMKSYADYRTLADRVVQWSTEGIIYTFDVDELLRSADSEFKPGEQSFLVTYILDQAKKGTQGDFAKAMVALKALRFGSETEIVYWEVLNLAPAAGLLKEAFAVLSTNVVTGSYSAVIGEVSPERAAKKAALISLRDRCGPGQIKSHVVTLIERVEQDIKRDLTEAEEILNPKS